MKLLTAPIEKKLFANAAATQKAQEQNKPEPDHIPVVKFFNPIGAATWIFTEAERNEETGDIILFGLCDLGFGTPELGSVSLNELAGFRGRFGLGIERDRHWSTDKPLSKWAQEASISGRLNA